jgi:ubiquinone/menaquinone biosynthesis C-methylase UbiE
MGEYAVRGGLQETVEKVTPFLLDRSRGKLLDLGGGHSLYSIALIRAVPGMEAVVFDLPDVIEGAAAPLASSHECKNIRFIKGDFMKDSLGHGYDAVLACNVLHRPRLQLQLILNKIHRSMKTGGILAVKETHVDDPLKNRFVTFFSLILSVYGSEEKVFPTAKFHDIIEKAGFRVLEDTPVKSASDSSRLTIARKERE